MSIKSNVITNIVDKTRDQRNVTIYACRATHIPATTITQACGYDSPSVATPGRPQATQLRIKSSSTNDTSDGDGCRSVWISGLDANFNIVEEILETNGQSTRNTVNLYKRVNNFQALTTGNGFIAGTITLEDTSSNKWSMLDKDLFGANSTIQSFFTTPAGYKARVRSIFLSAQRDTHDVEFCLQIRAGANETSAPYSPWINVFYRSTGNVLETIDLPEELVIPPLYDFRILIYCAIQTNCATNLMYTLEKMD